MQEGRTNDSSAGGGPRQEGAESRSYVIAEYIVEEKDTLADIARKYGVSIEEIMAVNKEIVQKPSDLAKPGLHIKIPQKRQ